MKDKVPNTVPVTNYISERLICHKPLDDFRAKLILFEHFFFFFLFLIFFLFEGEKDRAGVIGGGVGR